ncbi:MAG: YybH family protein [Aulosira sp. ZfuVER01]|nr:SgcJ/EcaC family oxidoreductase [Aulosira sp. ZfuVER01]MDZ8000505.1 SgcJ/EcaC family oxidoreductase [Aulosira sp. DedVER01a]MDZ8056461.1 SgcJ/EcaC family oxidoreductase [Aulosira sp. ZfuCHP01]
MTIAQTLNVRDAIIAANQNFMQTFARGDAASLANLYTQDAQILPTHSDFIGTRQGIEEFWQTIFHLNITQANLETIEVESHGNTAIEVGKYLLSDHNGQTVDTGKYIVIWKQEDGQWRLHRDIWNSSLPA